MSLLRSPGQSRLTDGQLDRYGVVHVTAKNSWLSEFVITEKSTFSWELFHLILCKTSIIFTGKYKSFI